MEYCVSGDVCDEIAVESTMFPGTYRFCSEHQKQLEMVSEELRKGTFNSRSDDDVILRYCETPGCPNRPLYGLDYCLDCNGDD